MPKVGSEGSLASRQTMSEIACRDMFEPEAISAGNDNTLWKTMESSARVLSCRFMATGHPTEFFETELRNIWCMFTLAAQNIDAHHPAQDRLLRIILCVRDRGVLQRGTKAIAISTGEENPVPLKHETQVADTSQGRIWADLPFLVQDMRAAWKKLMEPSASFAKCCNLTAAIARLAGLGLCDHAFSQCGLEIMKQALETQPTSPPSSSSSSAIGENMALVEIWLCYARDELLRLCFAGFAHNDPLWALDGQQSVGPLAREAGIDAVAGFSQERFSLWKGRLVSMKAKMGDDTSVEARCAHMITGAWNDYFGILPFKSV
ncbi:hypothetical protein ONZ43_g6079 [Nemania bipapillata]|uniref:Uncharacterized protein n=1 Tax=Nemania bipapillata TaxID=110536 RepID=A0ACC2I2Z8_9PEZI|nr:hypothetical protein ONZ43_g6079 [Nemania bipapillata]